MMPIFPLLMLATTLISVLLYLRSANDIFGLLAVTMAVACIVWGLVVAHWFIHLCFLIALFFLRKPKVIARVAANIK